MATDAPGPGRTEAGNVPMEIQLAADDIDWMTSDPAPPFTMLRFAVDGAGFDVAASNANCVGLTINWGGVWVMLSETAMLCAFPEHGAVAQATVTVPVKG